MELTTGPVRDLHGKVAVVVGGSRNQGAAFARLIAARGATTVVSYAHDDTAADRLLAELSEHRTSVEAVRSDARVAADVTILFEGVIERHRRLDIVVHTPGAVLEKTIAECTDDDFDHLVNSNFRSVFHTLRATGRHIQDDGRYIVLSSALTARPAPAYGLYTGSKAAVEHLVAAVARELGHRGITVNAIAPSPVDNSFFRAAKSPGALVEAALRNPRNRLATADDVAALIGWLISADARWISGQTLYVDGAEF
ncbi:SDR family oxidoreductase [Nocardia stercoris]|uniref:SDR family oxidoreductase n=1 Tax=Nocardia stercoris TaxID=2483361 RepID=UPI001319FAF0|nr:SDR family oxidoreductase [Nocardia stercoris]